jgi:hypothetical protein
VKLQRPWKQAELDACELRSKIRTNCPTRTPLARLGQFRRDRQLAGSATSGPKTQAAAQLLGGVALALLGPDLSLEELVGGS